MIPVIAGLPTPKFATGRHNFGLWRPIVFAGALTRCGLGWNGATQFVTLHRSPETNTKNLHP